LHDGKTRAVVDFFELEPYRKPTVGDLPHGVQKLIGHELFCSIAAYIGKR
jgi:hypothetical protein